MSLDIKQSPPELPGTPLRESDVREGRVLTFLDALQARYHWDAGAAIGHFLAELKAGRLVGRYCRSCERTLLPPRMFCEQCYRPTDEWVPLQDTGKVNTFSICYVRWDATRIAEPQLPAVVEIDGASPGMGMLHLLGEVEPGAIRVGLAVEAVWKPAEERIGAITDIRYFRPR